MKYIITESQLELLSENEAIMWVKRRINKDILGEYVREAEMQFPLLCEDFGDEFEYSDNVIRWAVDDFLTTREDMFLDDLYDEVSETIKVMCKDWFEDYLKEIFINTCVENS
jgi:hypothetical protein